MGKNGYQKHFLEVSGYQNPNVKVKIYGRSAKAICKKVRLSIEALIDKIKPAILQKLRFAERHEIILMVFFGKFRQSGKRHEDQINCFLYLILLYEWGVFD